MKTKNSLRVALIVIAILLISVVSITTFSISTFTGSAYDAGAAVGKTVQPYLAGLGLVFLVLILVRVVKKYA